MTLSHHAAVSRQENFFIRVPLRCVSFWGADNEARTRFPASRQRPSAIRGNPIRPRIENALRALGWRYRVHLLPKNRTSKPDVLFLSGADNEARTRFPASRQRPSAIRGNPIRPRIENALRALGWRYRVHLLPKNRTSKPDVLFLSGAGNEARTRYLHLGKVALYQMSYAREQRVL